MPEVHSEGHFGSEPIMQAVFDTRRSTTGWIYTFVGYTLSWRSILQDCILVSMTEAEYVATSEACKEALWISCLLGDFGSEQMLQVFHYARVQLPWHTKCYISLENRDRCLL